MLAEVDELLPGRRRRGAAGVQQRRRHHASSRATSSRSRPSASSRSGPARSGCCTDPDVVRADAGVLKVRGTNDCGRGVEGTGFLYADDRLMTNAHVVAGVDEPEVDDRRAARSPARSSTTTPTSTSPCSPSTPRPLPPLPFDREAEPEDGVAILGYPQDGPYDVQPGRIRAEQRLRSPNIYGEGTVIREVFSLRGLVRPGNSGGPDRVVGRRRGRRGVRGVGDRPRHRLRPHRRAGRAQRRHARLATSDAAVCHRRTAPA